MNAEDRLDFIDRYLRKELTGEELTTFEEKLRSEPEFLQEVESQRKIILIVKKMEILNILHKTHQKISEANKSNIQKYFDSKRSTVELGPIVLHSVSISAENSKIGQIFDDVYLLALLNTRKYISIPYFGDPNPPFQVKITSEKAMFQYLKIFPRYKGFSFHYGVLVENNILKLFLFGDFDPAKLTLIQDKQSKGWSIKLKIDSKVYPLKKVGQILPLSE
jgi:hypothetical protein